MEVSLGVVTGRRWKDGQKIVKECDVSFLKEKCSMEVRWIRWSVTQFMQMWCLLSPRYLVEICGYVQDGCF